MCIEGLFVHGGDLWRFNTPLSCLQPPQQGKPHINTVILINRNQIMSRERYNLSIAVFVLVLRGNEICMLRRANTGWMDGCYSLPAGGLEYGETLSCAAARELAEETGIHRAL
ncbi:NUDIX domain-containing protein [Klebsiella pneumoniae]|nr:MULTISPECIES: NUDIX domain-containing protein [Enterobacteriaceae]MDQ5696567.1 NUDIX domain-containing protein [Klebsiella pneumoniae]MDV1128985.1 NUDIX domain-containing protein [Klebsiella pneumoniae]MDX6903968.1 NUDIX domain-containing protein [Klebsiella pneumoniae]